MWESRLRDVGLENGVEETGLGGGVNGRNGGGLSCGGLLLVSGTILMGASGEFCRLVTNLVCWLGPLVGLEEDVEVVAAVGSVPAPLDGTVVRARAPVGLGTA